MSIETAVGVVVLKVLIVEDEELIWRPHRERFLRNFGGAATVLVATTLREAEELFRGNQDVDVVALDFNVPEDKGGDPKQSNTLALALEIQKTFKGPMYATSGQEKNRKALMAHGCTIECTEKKFLCQEIGKQMRLKPLVQDPQRAA